MSWVGHFHLEAQLAKWQVQSGERSVIGHSDSQTAAGEWAPSALCWPPGRETETRTHRCTCTGALTTVTRWLLCVVLHRAEKRDKSGEKRDKSEAIRQEAQHDQPAYGLPSLESCLGSPLLYSEQGTQNAEQPRPLCKTCWGQVSNPLLPSACAIPSSRWDPHSKRPGLQGRTSFPRALTPP